jgi:hypothetical protein
MAVSVNLRQWKKRRAKAEADAAAARNRAIHGAPISLKRKLEADAARAAALHDAHKLVPRENS